MMVKGFEGGRGGVTFGGAVTFAEVLAYFVSFLFIFCLIIF